MEARRMSKDVAILGAGMHPWGKWGRNFVEYGVHAAREALADAGVDWQDVQFIAGGETVRNGYAGYVAGSTIAQARRRMELYGSTEKDWAAVKIKNARHGLNNPNARYRKEVTEEEILASAMVAEPLRLLNICTTSDGGAAVVLSSLEYAKRRGIDA